LGRESSLKNPKTRDFAAGEFFSMILVATKSHKMRILHNANTFTITTIRFPLIRFFTLLGLLLATNSIFFAQNPQDLAIPVTVAAGTNPAAVLITWPAATPADLTLRRRNRSVPSAAWTTLLDQPNSPQNGYYDTNVTTTDVYEYEVVRSSGGLSARGYGYATFLTEPLDQRGKILIFIDSTSADALGNDLLTFKNDLRGDGWQVVPHKIGPATSVAWIKNRIVSAYNADPSQVKMVLLIGQVPVPYSGSVARDDQADHVGAWPADAYYGDVDGTWTDDTVSLPNTARPANRNVPGDGKWDQNVLPSPVELAVGRIDFRHLSAAAFGASPVELLRRYFQKNHRWRSGQYAVPRRALVDDELGWANGEALAADAWRNGFPLVGNDITTGHFLTQTTTQRYLYTHSVAANGGTYASAVGVATSLDFAQNDSVSGVFSTFYGPYIGDWDFETNPFLPSALAARGGVLACAWAGRPSWQLHALAANEPVGECLRRTQNARWDVAYGQSAGESGTHLALLGDPTLRAIVVPPPTNLSVVSNCNKMNLHWTRSTDPDVLGYHVYRSLSLDGPYTRQTTNLVDANSWIDFSPIQDTLFYAVRAVRLDQSPGTGAFYNASTSDIKWVVFVPGQAPTTLGLGGTLTCNQPTLIMGANFQPPTCTYEWYRPDGSPNNGFVATFGGVYTVVVTAPNGCTASANATVYQDTAVQVVNFPATLTLDCGQPTASFEVPSAVGATQFFFNDQPVASGQVLALTDDATLRVTSSSNGCSDLYALDVTSDFAPPGSMATTDGNDLDCSHPTIQLFGASPAAGATYAWSSGAFFSNAQNPVVTAAGTYCLTVTGTNACESTSCVDVLSVGGALSALIVSDAPACPDGSSVTLTAQVSGGSGNYTYAWSTGGSGPTTVLPTGFSGAVSLDVSDQTGCLGAAVVGIAPPLTLQIDSDAPLCETTQAVTLTAIATGGTGPLGYLWSDGSATQVLALPAGFAGVRTVTVTDAAGCTQVSTTGVSSAMAVIALTDFPSSATATDGSIELLVFGGLAPYAYAWSTGATVASIGNLPSGTYTVTVTGSNGCTTATSIPIIVVGTQDVLDFGGVKMWPNPARAFLRVQLEELPHRPASVQLFDAVGRPVASARREAAGVFYFETKKLPAGVYVLRIEMGGRQRAYRVVLAE
jgi:hypothetical protein